MIHYEWEEINYIRHKKKPLKLVHRSNIRYKSLLVDDRSIALRESKLRRKFVESACNNEIMLANITKFSKIRNPETEFLRRPGI